MGRPQRRLRFGSRPRTRQTRTENCCQHDQAAIAIQSGPFSFLDTLAVVDLLTADAARPESLLDLSLVPEGDEVRPHASAPLCVALAMPQAR